MRGKREAGREEKERESFNLWVKKKKTQTGRFYCRVKRSGQEVGG